MFPRSWIEARRNRRKHRERTRHWLWATEYPRCEQQGCTSCQPWNAEPGLWRARLGRLNYALAVMDRLAVFRPRLRGTAALQALDEWNLRENYEQTNRGLLCDPLVIDLVALDESAVLQALEVELHQIESTQKQGHRVLFVEDLLALELWERTTPSDALLCLGPALDLDEVRERVRTGLR